MIYKRRKFSKVEAFQYTQAMEAGTDPVPEGFDVEKKNYRPNLTKPETELRHFVKHSDSSGSWLSPGVWILKCTETGETMAIFDDDYFRNDFEEAKQ